VEWDDEGAEAGFDDDDEDKEDWAAEVERRPIREAGWTRVAGGGSFWAREVGAFVGVCLERGATRP
jgi:hypothetical protein